MARPCYKQSVTQPLRRRLTLLALALLTVALGLALRLIPIGLPAFAVQYGGSILWAAMVYLLFAAAMPRGSRKSTALIACLFAAIVELSRLHHTPAFDAFRLTLTGKLLLGRVFNLWHFPIYWVTISLTAGLDRKSGSK